MFVKKLEGSIKLYINYQKLNIITKKNYYLLLLINKIITNITNYKIIIKLNIQKAFNYIQIITLKDKDLIVFYIFLSNYKSKILGFSLYNRLITF